MTSNDEIQPEYVDLMRALGEALDHLFNGDAKGADKRTGFALLVFPFGDEIESRTNYISNANRKDMIDSMREFIARAEGALKDSDHFL